jgi:hypothetical protein
MTALVSETFRSLSWPGKLGRIVMAIIGLVFIMPAVLLVLAPLGLWAVTDSLVSEYCLRSRMRRRGRFLSMRRARKRIAAGGGTLIIESPSLGWGCTRAWWTSEDALTLAPHSPPAEADYRKAIECMKCLDWDRWFWENYTSPDRGRAFLVGVWNGASMEAKLKARFPGLKTITTWTALVHINPTTQTRTG